MLAEHAAYQGNFSKVAAECLQKARAAPPLLRCAPGCARALRLTPRPRPQCPAHNAKFTYNADKHTFNFIVHNGYSAPRLLAHLPRGARRRH